MYQISCLEGLFFLYIIGIHIAGLVTSSQLLAYTISKFLGGLASDYMSPKFLFSFGLFFSGVITIVFTCKYPLFIFHLTEYMAKSNAYHALSILQNVQ